MCPTSSSRPTSPVPNDKRNPPLPLRSLLSRLRGRGRWSKVVATSLCLHACALVFLSLLACVCPGACSCGAAVQGLGFGCELVCGDAAGPVEPSVKVRSNAHCQSPRPGRDVTPNSGNHFRSCGIGRRWRESWASGPARYWRRLRPTPVAFSVAVSGLVCVSCMSQATVLCDIQYVLYCTSTMRRCHSASVLSIVSFIKVQDSAISLSLFAGDAYSVFIFQVCKLPVSFPRPKLPEPYSNPTAATSMLLQMCASDQWPELSTQMCLLHIGIPLSHASRTAYTYTQHSSMRAARVRHTNTKE